MEKIHQLKSRGFDVVKQIESLQRELMQINQQIQVEYKQLQDAKPLEPKEEKGTD